MITDIYRSLGQLIIKKVPPYPNGGGHQLQHAIPQAVTVIYTAISGVEDRQIESVSRQMTLIVSYAVTVIGEVTQ